MPRLFQIYFCINFIVTMPWNAILPQLPSVTDLILNLLTNIPKIVERLTKIVEFKEYEQVIINSILLFIDILHCQIVKLCIYLFKIYPLFMETLNSSWPCDGGMSNQCIQDEFMTLDVIQDIDNIVIHFTVG